MIDEHPPRGAFDYLLEPIRDQLQPPPPPPKRDGGSGPQRIHREITERRAAKSGITGLIVFGSLAWGIGVVALLAWVLLG